MSNPFPETAPDFSDPLGLLLACHGRIREHCALLEKLAEQLHQQGTSSEVAQAAARVHRYFSIAARHHHDDEEQDLFPLLARQSLKLADQVHHLRQQHRQLDALWQALAPQLKQPGSIADPAAFVRQAAAFAAAWRAHVDEEEQELLNLAQHILGSHDLKKLGKRMAERRGVTL